MEYRMSISCWVKGSARLSLLSLSCCLYSFHLDSNTSRECLNPLSSIILTVELFSSKERLMLHWTDLRVSGSYWSLFCLFAVSKKLGQVGIQLPWRDITKVSSFIFTLQPAYNLVYICYCVFKSDRISHIHNKVFPRIFWPYYFVRFSKSIFLKFSLPFRTLLQNVSLSHFFTI